MLQMEGILPLKAQQEMQTSNLSFITKARKFSNVESEGVAIFFHSNKLFRCINCLFYWDFINNKHYILKQADRPNGWYCH